MRSWSAYFLCLAFVAPLAAASSLPYTNHLTSGQRKPAPSVAAVQGFSAQVIRVSDGDSVTVRYGALDISVRLANIDAPERGQPWSQRSRADLVRLVGGQTIEIIPLDKDRYGRTVARLMTNGQNVNTEMVRLGAAWAYRAYLTDRSLLGVEAEARRAGRGLWSMPENTRIPPWEQRQQKDRKKARTGVYGPEL
jgi:endonuclease YncB( thermonuclease family)